MRSKLYKSFKKEVPEESIDLASAISLLKKNGRKSFDETVELHVHLGVDAGKSDQMVRGQVKLPAGSAKQQKIVVFTDDESQQKSAIKAGALKAGGEKMINEISEAGSIDADLTIATSKMMPKVAKVAKILGPLGIMPNPKTNTVTNDPAELVAEMQAGKITYKMDQQGNIHQAVGKISWEESSISDNASAFLESIKSNKPSSTKGEFIKSITIKSTMSPAVKLSH